MQRSTINISVLKQIGEKLLDLRKSYIQDLYTGTEKALGSTRTVVQTVILNDMSIKNIKCNNLHQLTLGFNP
jgi:hypothetical protein